MSQSKRVLKSAIIIIVFSITSKLLGFARESLIAAKFGSSAMTDTFFIALTAISLFTSIIINSINNTMIPVFFEIESIKGKRGKKEHTNNFLNIVVLVSVFIMILAWFSAPIILRVLAYGFHGEQLQLALLMVRLGLPAIIFAGIQGVFMGYLQSELMFIETAATLFPFNIVYLAYLIFLSGTFGIKGLMVASVFAVAAQIIIQLPGVIKTGFRYKAILSLKDEYVRKIVLLIPPVLMSVAVGDLNKIIDKSMASTLAVGSISALNYADRLNGIIISIFVSAISTVIFPMLSNEANKGTYDKYKKVIINGINTVLLITIPATIAMIILANPLVRIAFQRGAFSIEATHMTVGALIFYSIGLVSLALLSLLNLTYYSLQDTKTPMIISFISVGINITFNFILIRPMAHKGLALATSISSVIAFLMLIYGLRKKIGSFGFFKSAKCGVKALLASAIMGVVVYFINMGLMSRMGGNTLSEFIALLITVGAGLLVYSIIIYFFRIEEMEWVIKVVREKFAKLKEK